MLMLRHIHVKDIDDSNISIKNLNIPTNFDRDTTMIAEQVGKKFRLISGFARFQILKNDGHKIIPVLIDEKEEK